MKRMLMVTVAAAMFCLAPSVASAHVRGGMFFGIGGRVGVGFGGVACYRPYYPAWYAPGCSYVVYSPPVYYVAPPPVVYAPPAVVYSPPPVVYSLPPTYVPPAPTYQCYPPAAAGAPYYNYGN